MTDSFNPRVVFFQVSDNQTKLRRIAEMAQFHFQKKEPILILVDNDKSATFVDEFLWKVGFIPHTIAEVPLKDYIVISKVKKNMNHAKIVFNLCPTPLFIEGPFKLIYELEDLTAASKKNLSTIRFDAYKQAGYLIEAR